MAFLEKKSKVFVVTGGLGNIGTYLINRLLEQNNIVVIIDYDYQKFNKLIELKTLKDDKQIVFKQCNLESELERNATIESILTEYQEIDCLVNNAAYVSNNDFSGWNETFVEQRLDMWRSAIEVNLTAPFHFARDLLKPLKNAVDGNIINISSIYAQVGPDWSLYNNTSMGNPAAYSVSKGGLEQLTRWLATTLAPDVRVNCVAPGGIFRNQHEAFVKRYEVKTPMKRMGKENDIIGAIAFLSGEEARYITGQILNVDGGFTAW